jgi:hypothetical protein
MDNKKIKIENSIYNNINNMGNCSFVFCDYK